MITYYKIYEQVIMKLLYVYLIVIYHTIEKHEGRNTFLTIFCKRSIFCAIFSVQRIAISPCYRDMLDNEMKPAVLEIYAVYSSIVLLRKTLVYSAQSIGLHQTTEKLGLNVVQHPHPYNPDFALCLFIFLFRNFKDGK